MAKDDKQQVRNIVNNTMRKLANTAKKGTKAAGTVTKNFGKKSSRREQTPTAPSNIPNPPKITSKNVPENPFQKFGNNKAFSGGFRFDLNEVRNYAKNVKNPTNSGHINLLKLNRANKRTEDYVFKGNDPQVTPSGHTVNPNKDLKADAYKRGEMQANFSLHWESVEDNKVLDKLLDNLADGKPLTVDPSDSANWSLEKRITYDPNTGIRLDLLRAGPLLAKTGRTLPKDLEDLALMGAEMEQGRYSFGMDDEYFKKLNDSNYMKESLYDEATNSYKTQRLLRINANRPTITSDAVMLGDYYKNYTYTKNGVLYRTDNSPEVPAEFEYDDDGNIIGIKKINYNYYTVSEDGSVETHNYTDADYQKFDDAWAMHCVLANAGYIEARKTTERMHYTAGWNIFESDSIRDIGADYTADMSIPDYEKTSHGNRKGYESNAAEYAVPHLFKNLGHYFKTYLYTPLRKGDMRVAVSNGLVNLAETCDYAGIGSRAAFAPILNDKFNAGITYYDDNAWERVARAYTTHHNYDPESDSMGKNMAIYMFTDPSVYFTIGGIAAAKLSARAFSKAAMLPLRNRLAGYGLDLAKGSPYSTALKKEYKSLARDIVGADKATIEKHAERIVESLRKVSDNDAELPGTFYGLSDEIINDMSELQNIKNYRIAHAFAVGSDLVNSVDNFFLAGGLYLPYSVIKTIKGTRSIMKSNQWIANKLPYNPFKNFEDAQRLYKYYKGGGSILDFHHIIDGFKNMKSLNSTESFKSEAALKIRRDYLKQQRQLAAAVARFVTSKEGFSNRLALLNLDIQKIFKIDIVDSAKGLDELEEHLTKISGKATGINKDVSDILENMLSRVKDAKETIELVRKNDVNRWVAAFSNAKTSDEVQRLYQEYLSANASDPIAGLEGEVIDKFKTLRAEELGIEKDFVELPDGMVINNIATKNSLDSVPTAESHIDNTPVDSEVALIPTYLRDAREATQKSVSDVQDILEDLIVKDKQDRIVYNSDGSYKLAVESHYVRELFNYLYNVPKNDLSKFTIDTLRDKLGKALDSLRSKYGADFSELPTSKDLSKLIDGELTEDIFVYSGGPDLMKKVMDAGADEYFKLCHSPQVINDPAVFTVKVPNRKLREARYLADKVKLLDDERRIAYREKAANPSEAVKRKKELRNKLRNTTLERNDGTLTTAYSEYITMVRDFTDRSGGRKNAAVFMNKLDIAFNDILDSSALTFAKAEKLKEINIALSTYLTKVMSNPVLMDAIHQFDVDGPYGFLIEYKDEIYDFLQQNIEVGKDATNLEKLFNSIDDIESWRTVLDAYSNFHSTISAFDLSPREEAAILQYCIGSDPSYLAYMSRNPGYFFNNMQNGISSILGADKLLLNNYKETILRTSFIDESAWLSNHLNEVSSCGDLLTKISKHDVKMQILQAVELDKDAIRRFNECAEKGDVYFIRAITDGNSPTSPLVRIEVQKWVPVKEDVSLRELCRVIEDRQNINTHIFEVSEDLTEESIIKSVVELFDKGVKSGPDMKQNFVPYLVTHGRDFYDIDVLRQCCVRNNISSATLSNINTLFSNRINTFKELMLKDKHHVCLDPDKLPKIAKAVSSLVADISKVPGYNIFNVSKFSKSLNSLFDTLYDPAFLHDITSLYDCSDPFIKNVIHTQKEVKALRVEDYDEEELVKVIAEKLEQLFKDSPVKVENNKRLVNESASEESLEDLFEDSVIKIEDYDNKTFEYNLFSLSASFYNLLTRTEELTNFYKASKDLTDDLARMNLRYQLGNHHSYFLNNLKNTFSDLMNTINKDSVEVMNFGLPNDYIQSHNLFEKSIRNMLDELDSFNLGTTFFSNNFISEFKNVLNKLLDYSPISGNFKDTIKALDQFIPVLDNEFWHLDHVVNIKSFDPFKFKKNPNKDIQIKEDIRKALYEEDIIPLSDIKILYDAKLLHNDLLAYINKLNLNDVKAILEWSNNPEEFLSRFDYLKNLTDSFKAATDMPEAVKNNLIVFANLVNKLDSFNYDELKQFVELLKRYQSDLHDMLINIEVPGPGYNYKFHVSEVFSNYNQKSALLQQDILMLQQSVVNREFKEALKVTEVSPFIKDVFEPAITSRIHNNSGMLCESVKEAVNNIEHIRASQLSSCLSSKEFEGFEDMYAIGGFPMGTSAELKYTLSGQAYTENKAYDIDVVSNWFDITQTREGVRYSRKTYPSAGFKPKISRGEGAPKYIGIVIRDTLDLIEESRGIAKQIESFESDIEKYQEKIENIEKIEDLEAKKQQYLNKIDELGTPDDYNNYIKSIEKDIENKKKQNYATVEGVPRGKIDKLEKRKRVLEAERESVKRYLARVEEIDGELKGYTKDSVQKTRYQNLLDQALIEIKALNNKKGVLINKLTSNYELLKGVDGVDVPLTKTNIRSLCNDIQYLIETTDTFIRHPFDKSDIPAHELMALNKFANRAKHIYDFKLKNGDFLNEISTIDDWNRIINQTKKLAFGLDKSHPYHYLIYLKEAETIEEAFVVADILYNMFYKHLDHLKAAGIEEVDSNLIYASQTSKGPVTRLMRAGFDSIRLDVNNADAFKLLQGDGLNLVYKDVPEGYVNTVYYNNKISGNHAASANIVDILNTHNTRVGWAKKFAGSGKSIRDEAFGELENSQLEMLRIVKEISGTPYEEPCRVYLNELQNGLYKAQTLQVMSFITKSPDHLITELLYHNHQIVLPLRYSDDFAEYGKYLAKLDDILKEKPQYINFKNEGDEYLWIGLSSDVEPRIINDTKHVKEDTKFEIDGKVYDPKELNEHYVHMDIPDDIIINGKYIDPIIDISSAYCLRLRDYIRGCYSKLNFLSDGAIKGSAFTSYNLAKHRALRKAAPLDWLANSIRSSATCDQRLFHTSQFDFSILGESEYRFKIGGHYDDTDILQNIKHCYDDLAGTVSTERMYIANFFDENSHCKLANVFGPEFSNADKLAILRNNPDQCVLTLVLDKNTMTGYRVKKLRITDEFSIEQAERAHAIIADYETYVEMTRLINTSDFDKTWLKMWARVVFLLKVGHLCNPGTWVRNWIDATIKATGEVDGNIAKTAINQVKAFKYLGEYNKVVKYVRDNYGIHHSTSKRIDNEWKAIQAGTHTTLTKKQFDFMEGWLQVSLSGGESRMLTEMLKKQKYDPFRSGNLKPGNSFTYPGREAMQQQYDYLGSDLHRFEQIGEDEINRLIKEGYRKGENVFADDFSADQFWQIFNQRKNPETSYIADAELYKKYTDTVENLLTIRNLNLFRGNRSLGSKFDYMCSFFLKPMSKVEQIVRLGQYLMLESDGFTRSEIFKSIADTQFEYELKSSRVKYAELFLTYFNFEYNNLRYWCNLLENQPEYLYMLENIWNDLSWQAAQEYYQDEDVFNNQSVLYMMTNGALPIGSSGLYLKTFPSALGALNWFYAMPSQYMTSVVPPLEMLSMEMPSVFGGAFAQWMSNLNYSYSDSTTWEKALSLVPIAGTMYTRYIDYYKNRQPWNRLDDDSFGRWLLKCNPSVWGAVYQYNKPHDDDYEAFLEKLKKQGKWYDLNLDKVVDLEDKNTRGLNDPKLSFEKRDLYHMLFRGERWDNNFYGYNRTEVTHKKGHWTSYGSVFFDDKGNPVELGLNRYRDIRIPGEWESLEDDMLKYRDMKWDRNTDKFVPSSEWREVKLNRSDLTWAELEEYMLEKGKVWSHEKHRFVNIPEDARRKVWSYNRWRHYRSWRHFRRWVNYGDNPPAKPRINKLYRPKGSGNAFKFNYSIHDDNAALRMATSGYKVYDEYYKFEFKYNYHYRMPNPINQLRRYNPIIRYHILPK